MRFEVVNDMHRGRNRRENEQRRTKKSIEELHLRSQTCVSNKIIKKKHHPVLSTGEIRTNNNTFTTNGQVHVTSGAIKVREHVRHSISGRNFHAPSRTPLSATIQNRISTGAENRGARNGHERSKLHETRTRVSSRREKNVASTRIIREHVFGGDCGSVATPSASG